MSNVFKSNIEKLTISNKNYRKVIHSTDNMQIVLMCLNSKEEIGMEKHANLSQFIRVEYGFGIAIIGKKNQKRYNLKDGDIIVIPANTFHNIINTSTDKLKLYTIYSKPIHSLNCLQKYKNDTEC